jgi:hypothetical protein
MLTAIISVPAYLIKKRSKFILSSDSKIVLFGHSHSECAFNDTLIHNLKNLSRSGEDYFYNYPKVRMVLDQNPQIETVLIEFSNNQIDEKMDDWTWGYKYMSAMLPRYQPFINKDDLIVLLKNNPGDFMNCMSISTRKNISRIIFRNYNFANDMGGYLRLNKIETFTNSSNANKPINDIKPANLSDVNIKYLKKIIAYCQHMHKKVFLVRSPQNRNYEYLKNELQFLKVKNTLFAGIPFLDFNNFPLQDQDFADPGHLNYKGAIKFSKWFNWMLASGVLSDHKGQYLIGKEITALTETSEKTTNKSTIARSTESASLVVAQKKY